MSRAFSTLAAVLLLVAGCGNPLKGGGEGATGGEIIVGSSDVGEAKILAQIYATALRNAGADNVTVAPAVGSRVVVIKALRDGSLSLVPEYSGNLLRYFDEDTTATTSQEVYRELTRVLPEQFRVLEAAPAQDSDQLVVRPALASQGIRTISDLATRCDELVFGGPGQWEKRWAEKIKSLYGCEFKEIIVTDTGGPVTVHALASGQADVVDLFSTDASIREHEFVALEDDKHMFPAQNIVPLAAAGTLTERDVRALNEVSAALTTEKLTQLNVEYSVKKRNPVDIAEEFLRENGLAKRDL